MTDFDKARAAQAAGSYRFKDALGKQPVPCPACDGTRFHSEDCPIEAKKRRYFGIAAVTFFGPVFLSLFVWDLLIGGEPWEVLRDFLDVGGIVAATIGCGVAGFLIRRVRQRDR